MADELDLLQEQDELLNQLHIQAARQRSCLQGKSRNRCECCGNRIPLRRQQA
ncbi:conjugal transfer protein TraR, partial [Klebsiella pneumoniae]